MKRPRTVVVLFTRDLRVHDHPALAAALTEAERVVPLFVLDDGLLGTAFAGPNRLAFLLASLRDLHGALEAMGGGLVVRRGNTVREVVEIARSVGVGTIVASADVSAYAQRRQTIRAVTTSAAGCLSSRPCAMPASTSRGGSTRPRAGDSATSRRSSTMPERRRPSALVAPDHGFLAAAADPVEHS